MLDAVENAPLSNTKPNGPRLPFMIVLRSEELAWFDALTDQRGHKPRPLGKIN